MSICPLAAASGQPTLRPTPTVYAGDGRLCPNRTSRTRPSWPWPSAIRVPQHRSYPGLRRRPTSEAPAAWSGCRLLQCFVTTFHRAPTSPPAGLVTFRHRAKQGGRFLIRRAGCLLPTQTCRSAPHAERPLRTQRRLSELTL